MYRQAVYDPAVLPDHDCEEVSCSLPCHSFFDEVGDVVSLAYLALCETLPEEANCAEIAGFVSVGEPSHPLGEYIGGWLVEFAPFNPARSRGGDVQLVPRWQITVGLKLLEQGWPQAEVDGSDVLLPSLKTVNGAAYHSMGHGEVITRRLVRAVQMRELGATTGCTFMNLNRARPIQPSSGLVGWTWELLLEVTL